MEAASIEPQIIIVGEMHGTEQAPRFVSGLVCSLLQAGHGVIVALERNATEQGALNDFMASAGRAVDREHCGGNPTGAHPPRTAATAAP